MHFRRWNNNPRIGFRSLETSHTLSLSYGHYCIIVLDLNGLILLLLCGEILRSEKHGLGVCVIIFVIHILAGVRGGRVFSRRRI